MTGNELAENLDKLEKKYPSHCIISLTLEAMVIWDWLKSTYYDQIKSAYPPPIRVYTKRGKHVPSPVRNDCGSVSLTNGTLRTDWIEFGKSKEDPIYLLPGDYYVSFYVPNIVRGITYDFGSKIDYRALYVLVFDMIMHELMHFTYDLKLEDRVYGDQEHYKGHIKSLTNFNSNKGGDHDAISKLEKKNELITLQALTKMYLSTYDIDCEPGSLIPKLDGPYIDFIVKKNPDLDMIIKTLRILEYEWKIRFVETDGSPECIRLIKLREQLIDEVRHSKDKKPFIITY